MLKGEKINVEIKPASAAIFHVDEDQLPDAILYAAGAQGLLAACNGSHKLTQKLCSVTLKKMIKRKATVHGQELLVYLEYTFSMANDEYYIKNKRMPAVTEGSFVDMKKGMINMTTFSGEEILQLCARILGDE